MIDIETYIPGKIVCVGMDYCSHVREQDGRFPDKPVLFAKATSSIIKNNEYIIYPPGITELDYEVELAVIIGKTMKDIPVKEVEKYIYGYTIINDITARDIQKSEIQWFRAKSFDTFAPIGPAIIKQGSLENPQDLKLRSYVNGELRQDSTTGEMIFNINHLISFISGSMTLEPGDLVATGTPAGVGVFASGKKLLQPGDIVTCEIEKIGRLTNQVRAKHE